MRRHYSFKSKTKTCSFNKSNKNRHYDTDGNYVINNVVQTTFWKQY